MRRIANQLELLGLEETSRIPSFFCCKISSLAILNRRSNEARRCQGYHCAVKAALLEEYDRAEQVMADDFQVKNSIE